MNHQVERRGFSIKENYILRKGKLRIIYTIPEKDNTIYIIAIGPRKTIYE